MPSIDECRLFNQKLEQIERVMDARDDEVRDNIRQLNKSQKEISQSQKELTKSQQDNIEAIHTLTLSTQILVDTVTAGKIIGSFARWIVPILATIAAITAYFNQTPPPPS